MAEAQTKLKLVEEGMKSVSKSIEEYFRSLVQRGMCNISS
jgi:hypothetical protein